MLKIYGGTGRLSVKDIFVSAMLGFGLLTVKVSNVVSPVKIGFAVNALLMTGGAMTVIVFWPNPTFGVVLVLGPDSVEVIFVVVLV